MSTWNDVHTLPAQYRMKAHCPGLKGAPGTWIHLHMFNKCHPLLKWTTRKTKFWHKFYIGINERRCTSWQNHLKMWSIYWVMSFKALDTAECLLKRLQHAWLVWSLNESIVTLLIRPATYWVQEEDSKWEQMIYLWRGLTLKQILEKWTYRSPLDITCNLAPWHRQGTYRLYQGGCEFSPDHHRQLNLMRLQLYLR